MGLLHTNINENIGGRIVLSSCRFNFTGGKIGRKVGLIKILHFIKVGII